jgi:sugar phosphate isomerase/epimerase
MGQVLTGDELHSAAQDQEEEKNPQKSEARESGMLMKIIKSYCFRARNPIAQAVRLYPFSRKDSFILGVNISQALERFEPAPARDSIARGKQYPLGGPFMTISNSRRAFLKTSAVAFAAPAILRAAPAAKQAPIAFSTLGCPEWDWKTIIGRAQEWGYAGIELRGVKGEMDLPRVPEFSPSNIASTIRELKDRNLKISDLGASARMHEKDPKVREAQFDEAKRFIELAHKLDAPFVRIFGDKFVEGETKEATIDRIIEGMKKVGQMVKGTKVVIITETHGDFTSSDVIYKILSSVNMPEVALLWDTRHTVVTGGEMPADTWKKLGKWVRHTHIKDSVGEKYVLPGTGTVPLKEIVQVLKKGGYKGYYCFEWEKKWHPEIEEPEVAFPRYAKVMRELLQS